MGRAKILPPVEWRFLASLPSTCACVGTCYVNNHGVVGGPSLRLENARDRGCVQGIGSQAIDSFGGKCHQTAPANDGRRARWQPGRDYRGPLLKLVCP